MSGIIILLVVVSIINSATESSGGSVGNLGGGLVILAVIGLVAFIVNTIRKANEGAGQEDDWKYFASSNTDSQSVSETPSVPKHEEPLRRWSDGENTYEEWEETITYYENGERRTRKEKHKIRKPK